MAEDRQRPGNPLCVVKQLKLASDRPQHLQVARRLFQLEAETLEKLRKHDQIPQLLAYFEQDEDFYLVQEYIVGHPLSSLFLFRSSPSTKSLVKKLDLTQANRDAELGTLRVQEQKLQSPPAKKIGHLLGQVGYFQSNNIFSGVDPVNDGLISSGLTLLVAPELGKKTSFVTAIDGIIIRYLDHSDVNYNQLRIRAGIRDSIDTGNVW